MSFRKGLLGDFFSDPGQLGGCIFVEVQKDTPSPSIRYFILSVQSISEKKSYNKVTESISS